MKILFVSASPLRREISIGNTFLDLFSEVESVELASVYTKGGVPDSDISAAFLITEKMLLKHFFRKSSSVGKKIDRREAEYHIEADSGHEFKKSTFSFFHKNRWTIFFWLQNAVWSLGSWKSKELREFVHDYRPDVIFTLLTDAKFLNQLILYIQSICHCRLAVFAWDDNYSYKLNTVSPLRYLHQTINRVYMRRVVSTADCLYAISDIQEKEYEDEFRKEFKILTKAKDFSGDAPLWPAPAGNVRLLYAGNLGVGRWKSLALIAEAVERLNGEGYNVSLNIYSATPQTKAMQGKLNRPGTVLHGAVSFEEVQQLQNEADVLIHVEGLSLKSRMAVHQSFSTKLVDYFALGKCIFAVGTPDVASIQHLLSNDAAVVAEEADAVYKKLKGLLDRPELLKEYGQKAYLCGRNNHDKAKMQTMLMNDLKRVIEGYENPAD